MIRRVDIVIFGAGIAGLWLLNALRGAGYSVLLLESRGIGGGQSIASQGILHSGLKYALAGQVNALARSISAMPEIWRGALGGEADRAGGVDLSAAHLSAESQSLLIPDGLGGGVLKHLTKRMLGKSSHEVQPTDWPEGLCDSGFKGSVLFMGEPVLEVASVVQTLAAAYRDSIRRIDTPDDPFGFLERHGIEARDILFTGAGSNHSIAEAAGHAQGLKTQRRPLLMGMLKPAPFPLYAHCVGRSEKPVMSITTHRTVQGELVWYLGGGVAERAKESDPEAFYKAARSGFARYLPDLDLSDMEWAVFPIDRVEGSSNSGGGWMPDMPTVHSCGTMHYCWPTKLTFAPLLAERVLERLSPPSSLMSEEGGAWDFLPDVDFALAPWDKATWTKLSTRSH